MKESALRMLLLFILRHFGMEAAVNGAGGGDGEGWGAGQSRGSLCAKPKPKPKWDTLVPSTPASLLPQHVWELRPVENQVLFYFKIRGFWCPAPMEQGLLVLLAATNTEYPEYPGGTDSTAPKY